jgi:pyruvate, water dikinase
MSKTYQGGTPYMIPTNKAIVWFDEVGKDDVSSVGGKGANLGELTNAHIPVPPGFIVTSKAYYDFVKITGVAEIIREKLNGLDTSNSRQLQQVSEEIQDVITKAKIPDDLSKQIKEAYSRLGGGFVAVRSSATAEDMPEASFAGQQSTFLNVESENNVVDSVKGCWASLFNARAIFYREEQNFDHLSVGIAVPVQRMVQSEASGVMFTIEPVTSDKRKIVVESVYGLGEAIVSGEVTPDLFIIDKDNLHIISRKIHKQEWQLIKNPDPNADQTNIKVSVAPEDQTKQKISDTEVLRLAEIGKLIEKHYGLPQDIEWAKEHGELYITQARPVTTIRDTVTEINPEIGGAPILLSGSPASPGTSSGPVKILTSPQELPKIEKGDVLVAEMTTPDYVPAMKKAAGIITDQGGRTSHAAIISRELGIPCIVGAEKATKVLQDKMIITIDGSTGKIYEGNIIHTKHVTPPSIKIHKNIKTKTKVYVNLAQPDMAEAIAAKNVDGVGLLRAEFIMGQIGEHPRYMLNEKRGSEYIDKLYEGVNVIAKAFHPRPVIYRCSDLKTNEYRNLKGGDKYEQIEENPMLGYRGCSRYLREPDLFELEVEAIKRVREYFPNLHVMIPFVRTVSGMAQVKELLEDQGLVRSDDFKLWMMVELPTNVFLIDKFIDVGIDGVSIGSNDLTQLTLGTDRDNGKLSSIFDERNEAVQMAIERVIKTTKQKGITCSICGQAPSVYPEVTERLVELGTTSVSVTPDMIEVTREIIAEAEKKYKVDA